LKTHRREIKRKNFMKNFRDCAEIYDSARFAGFCARIQKLAFEFRNCSAATPAKTRARTANQRIVRSCA
jgi:hypothetical protein